MGITTNGIVAFCVPAFHWHDMLAPWLYPIRDDGELDWEFEPNEDDEEMEFEEWYAREFLGLERPVWPHEYHPRHSRWKYTSATAFDTAVASWEAEHGEAYAEHEKARTAYFDAREAAFKDLDVTMQRHCHADSLYWVAAIRSSVQVAHRGDVVPLSLSVHPDWDEKLRAFCARLAIPMEQPAMWQLMAFSDC